MCWFFVNLTQVGVIWEEGTSTEELASLRPVDLSGAFSSLMIAVYGPRPLRVVPALGWWSGLHKKVCRASWAGGGSGGGKGKFALDPFPRVQLPQLGCLKDKRLPVLSHMES